MNAAPLYEFECQRRFGPFTTKHPRRRECDSCRYAAQQVWPRSAECMEASGSG